MRGIGTFTRRAFSLVWSTSRPLAVGFAILTLLGGLFPGFIAYVSKLLVDSTVQARALHNPTLAYRYVAMEAVAVILLALTTRAVSLCGTLLRAQLGQRVNEMILEKALTLSLSQFEDAEFYNKLTTARRQASNRPLSLVQAVMELARQSLVLSSFGVILWGFSPWAVLLLVMAGIPSFVVEAKFAQVAFRLFSWRSPEARMQNYLEMLVAREDNVKEIKLFGLGQLFLDRYRKIFRDLYAEDRNLTVRRAGWSYGLGLLSTAALYFAYWWIVRDTVAGRLSLGEMSMFLLVFKQGQSAVSGSLGVLGGMYEDNLYVSNLYEFLNAPVPQASGSETRGPQPEQGLEFREVSYTYPGSTEPALEAVSFQLRPGQKLALVGENGSGKTTIVKLLSRLYDPTSGTVLLDGLDLQMWDSVALQNRISVIFQDFNRYQLPVGENIGVGDLSGLDDEQRWKQAAGLGQADEVVESLPKGYATQLGSWFPGGRDLSGGQWQKIALSRAFMRSGADLLVLDEPTSAVDPRAEAQIFEHLRRVTEHQMAILISHRFSTVRMADHILVLDRGRVLERGSHEELLEQGGNYAQLFALQAAGYK